MSRRTDRADRLAALLGPVSRELSCEECFDTLDRYVDMQIFGLPADAAHPGMAAHLAGCPACREEHESLLAVAGSRPH